MTATLGAARFPWPSGHRCGAMLSFDVDAESAILRIDPRFADRPSAMSHQTYGAGPGIRRILATLEQLELAATFFVPAYTAERYPDVVRAIAAGGHEVGCHGYLHEPPAALSADEERSILERSVETIEALSGKRPVGYRAPLADPSTRTPELLAEYGFLYDSSLTDEDVPYTVQTGAGTLVELPIQWALDDWEQYAFLIEPNVGQLIEPPSKVLELWRTELEAVHDEGLLFIGIMHPELSGRPARARVIRGIVEEASALGGVWWATGEQIARHALEATSETRRGPDGGEPTGEPGRRP